jgi:Actin
MLFYVFLHNAHDSLSLTHTHGARCVYTQVTPTAVRRVAEGGVGVDDSCPVVRPVRRGVVTDWDAVESIYHHVFYEQVRAQTRRAARCHTT